MELTILMPCLNEIETIGNCIEKAQKFLNENNIDGEILIADNGSNDGTLEFLTVNNIRYISVKEKGYGSALINGTKEALGDFIIMGDADDSYDFYHLSSFIKELRSGADLVMGNRFKGVIEKGAMPFLNRYLGTPILSFIGRTLYKNNIGDYNCGIRGYNRQKFLDLRLNNTGMEYASEMIIKASLANYKIVEVPTTLSVDGRTRKPHLRPWRDGFRHLNTLIKYKIKYK